MSGKISALIFDLDGTLIDTMPAHYLAWKEAIKAYDWQFTEEHFYSMAGWPTLKVAQVVMAACGNPEPAEVIASRKESLFLAHLSEMRPIEPVVAIARRFAGRLPMAIATGSRAGQADTLLNLLGIKDLFQVILTADDGLPGKPHPAIFLKAAELMGAPAKECLVFEDGEAGLAAAAAAGMARIDVRKSNEISTAVADTSLNGLGHWGL